MDSRGFPGFTRDVAAVDFGAGAGGVSESASGCTDSFLLFLDPSCASMMFSSDE